jgi:hypothetical protein
LGTACKLQVRPSVSNQNEAMLSLDNQGWEFLAPQLIAPMLASVIVLRISPESGMFI